MERDLASGRDALAIAYELFRSTINGVGIAHSNHRSLGVCGGR